MRRPTVKAILKREYPVTLYTAQEGGFVAEHRDLPGCLTQGETVEEALDNLAAARRLWISTAVEHGDEVPSPVTDERFGGRVLVRMPRSLHRSLVEAAARDGVSLNQLIVMLLSERSRDHRLATDIEGLHAGVARVASLVATYVSEPPAPAPLQPGRSPRLPAGSKRPRGAT